MWGRRRWGERTRRAAPSGKHPHGGGVPPRDGAIDEVEVGHRSASHIRVAFRVPDSQEASERLIDAGAVLIAPPTVTPWRSLNARLEAPADLQLTLFSQAPPAAEVGDRP